MVNKRNSSIELPTLSDWDKMQPANRCSRPVAARRNVLRSVLSIMLKTRSQKGDSTTCARSLRCGHNRTSRLNNSIPASSWAIFNTQNPMMKVLWSVNIGWFHFHTCHTSTSSMSARCPVRPTILNVKKDRVLKSCQ